MGPVRQNPIQRTVSLFICVSIALCTIVAHNIAQSRPDSFPPYPPDNHHISDDVYLREEGVSEIGQPLLKLSLVVGWYPFLRHSVCANSDLLGMYRHRKMYLVWASCKTT